MDISSLFDEPTSVDNFKEQPAYFRSLVATTLKETVEELRQRGFDQAQIDYILEKRAVYFPE